MYDLHCHSNCSDGSLEPTALVNRAHDMGVTHLALTDHDTLAGLPEARQAADTCGISLISGIELSCCWKGMTIHMVGLAVDCDAPVIQAAVQRQLDARLERAEMIGQRLARLGIPDSYAGATQLAGDSVIGRPHFARYLVEKGLVKDTQAAFKRYLGAGKPGDVKQQWPEIGVAVEWVRQSGGIAVLAHPAHYKLTLTKLQRLLSEFKEAGGMAMEVCSGRQAADITQKMATLVTRNEMMASTGSDFHEPGVAGNELGCQPALPDSCTPVWSFWESASN